MKAHDFFKKTLYYKIIFDSFNMDLSPSIVGYEVCNRNKPTIDSNKSCYLLHFVLDGQGYLFTPSGQTIFVQKDDCFLIEPNSHIRYRPNSDNPWSYIWLELNGDLTKKLCEAIGYRNNNMVLHLDNMEIIADHFADLFNDNMSLINQNAEALRIQSILFDVFSIIINEKQFDFQNHSISHKEQQTKQILDYLNANYTSSDISVSKVSEHFYFNPAYLTRIFKEATGLPPMKYIIMLRMRRAVELLSTKNFSISQIAYALGYKNQFYFSKEFKKYYGVQPSKYIKPIEINHNQ
ncbi:MAG: AraC family transcriptional regulator [Bacillales bacterium]|nr:AraC family transcriptional regulator [Bacillales bacterium]